MSCTEYCERLVNMPPMLLGNIGGMSAHNTQAWNYDSVPVFLYLAECPWEHCTIIELKTLSLPEKLMNMTKEEKYLALLPQIQALLAGETDEVARMSNIVAMLNSEFGFWWTGFYRVASSEELVLGPFQGPVACMRIAKGRGVCGTSWNEERTVIVPDVELFPGHIACSSESRSEIVVPCWKRGRIAAVLDIDSKDLNTFDEVDRKYLEEVTSLLYGKERDIWFAAGCFWGAQKFFKLVDGVVFTEVGFANGWEIDPTYKQVYTDETGHAECVHVRYDPEKVSLERLVNLFLNMIDPFSLNKQGEDEGTRYRTGVYYDNGEDREVIETVLGSFENKAGRKSAVELQPLRCFYKAEEYHQNYLVKNPGGYCHLSPAIFELARKTLEEQQDSVPQKPVSCTKGKSICLSYTRAPSLVPFQTSFYPKATASTDASSQKALRTASSEVVPLSNANQMKGAPSVGYILPIYSSK